MNVLPQVGVESLGRVESSQDVVRVLGCWEI